MRLAHSSLHAYCLPYARPVKWSDIIEEGGSFLLLRLESDTGHTGVAELTLKPTWTGQGLKSLSASLMEVMLPRLQGIDLDDEAAVAQCLLGVPGQHAARALVDNAVWDMRGAGAGQPLWQRWGGRQDVPVSFTVTRQAPDAMAREAVGVVERLGVSTLKIKGGQGADVDSKVLRMLRAAVGDGIAFYIDANGAYRPDEAIDYARTMFDAGARVVEDPCALQPGSSFRSLQSALDGAILVDFNCWGSVDMAVFRESGARAFSLKPTRLGLSETRAMLRQTQASDDTTVVGMFGESAVGTWQALALASLPDNALPAEVTWFLAMQQHVLHDVPEIRGGSVRLPLHSSVAELIDWKRVTQLAIAQSVEATHI